MSFERTRKLIASRPKEFVGTALGAASGVPVGLAIGGVGVAALGGAVGVPALLICGVVGAISGNRIGLEMDRSSRD